MLTYATEPVIRQIINLPDDIRGYEDLKLQSAAKARQLAADLLGDLSKSTEFAAGCGIA